MLFWRGSRFLSPTTTTVSDGTASFCARPEGGGEGGRGMWGGGGVSEYYGNGSGTWGEDGTWGKMGRGEDGWNVREARPPGGGRGGRAPGRETHLREVGDARRLDTHARGVKLAGRWALGRVLGGLGVALGLAAARDVGERGEALGLRRGGALEGVVGVEQVALVPRVAERREVPRGLAGGLVHVGVADAGDAPVARFREGRSGQMPACRRHVDAQRDDARAETDHGRVGVPVRTAVREVMDSGWGYVSCAGGRDIGGAG